MSDQYIVKPILKDSKRGEIIKYAVLAKYGSDDVLFIGTKGECEYFILKREEEDMPF